MKLTSLILLAAGASAKHHLREEFQHLENETHADNKNGLIFESDLRQVHHELEHIKHQKDD